MQLALADLKSGELKLVGSGTPFEEYTRIVGVERWARIEREFGQPVTPSPSRAPRGR